MRSAVPLTALVAAVAGQTCDPVNASVRKEWGSLTPTERTDYIDAVLCLRELPSQLPSSGFPGVKDRFDDFVATHINSTMVIHKNGVLLSWHRHYIWLWEQALRNECGYKGSVPYWDWTISPDLYSNPLFDNSPTSLSGNGVYSAAAQAARDPSISDLPPGTGGGCVTGGPFKNFTVHMGPFAYSEAYPDAPVPSHAFDYNPRCLQRNLQPLVLAKYNTPEIVQKMVAASDLNGFLALLDPSSAGQIGAHGAAHDSMGPTMGDVFASPQDPVFMSHHAMVDRLWTTWQGRDKKRIRALNGTAVLNNPPDAELVTLDTVTQFGILDRPRALGELMDTLAGVYCYTYE